MHVLVLGANGAIGLSIANEVLKQYPDATVHGTWRRNTPDKTLCNNKIHWHHLDITKESDIEHLATSIPELDWMINTVGMLHTPERSPEKNIRTFDTEFFLESIQTNTLPTLLLAKYFMPHLKRSETPRFVALSARVGSIEDNRLGGWYSYRISKSALNMTIKNLSIEWSRYIKKGVVIAFHPGTTDSELSKPFQKNVPEGKLFSGRYVAQSLLSILAELTPQDSGHFLDYQGESIPW